MKTIVRILTLALCVLCSCAVRGIPDLGRSTEAQDIAEYAVMLAIILVVVVGTIALVGSNTNSMFSQVLSAVQ